MSAGGAAAAPAADATSTMQPRSAALENEAEVCEAIVEDRPDCIKCADAQHELARSHEQSAGTTHDAQRGFDNDDDGAHERQHADDVEPHQQIADLLVATGQHG